MWLTSNSPARVRTAMCSSVMPEYSTGMSQPANSTIRAPIARCLAFRGVFLPCATGGDEDIGLCAGSIPYKVLSAVRRVKERKLPAPPPSPQCGIHHHEGNGRDRQHRVAGGRLVTQNRRHHQRHGHDADREHDGKRQIDREQDHSAKHDGPPASETPGLAEASRGGGPGAPCFTPPGLKTRGSVRQYSECQYTGSMTPRQCIHPANAARMRASYTTSHR